MELKSLKELIKSTEIRISEYKNLLEIINKDKINYQPDDEFTIWFKSNLRDLKNDDQILLKTLI